MSSKKPGAAIAAFLVFLLLASPSAAVEIRSAEGENKSLTVPVGETVDDTLIILAETVIVDGTVTGNLITLGRAVQVNGQVQGDLICATENLLLKGAVEGNLLSFARRIDFNGTIGKSAHVFAQDIRFTNAANTAGDLFAFGSDLFIEGTIGRDALLFSRYSDVGGSVERNLTARTGVLTLTDSARVGGDLTAHVSQEDQVRIASGATIAGVRETKLSEHQAADDDERFGDAGAFLRSVVWHAFGIAAGFVTGLVLFLLFPSLFAAPIDEPTTVARTMGIGFLCLVAVPIAAFILMATLIGIPIGVLVFLTWLVGLYASSIIVAGILGARMLRKPAAQLGPFAVALLFGLIVLTLATTVPFLGLFVRLAVTTLGLGVLCTWTYSRWKPTGTEVRM